MSSSKSAARCPLVCIITISFLIHLLLSFIVKLYLHSFNLTIYISIRCYVFMIYLRDDSTLPTIFTTFHRREFFKLASCTLEITRASRASYLRSRFKLLYDAPRDVKCVSKIGCVASLSAKSLSLRPVENARRKHCAEVDRTGEWNVVALSERIGSLLK